MTSFALGCEYLGTGYCITLEIDRITGSTRIKEVGRSFGLRGGGSHRNSRRRGLGRLIGRFRHAGQDPKLEDVDDVRIQLVVRRHGPN